MIEDLLNRGSFENRRNDLELTTAAYGIAELDASVRTGLSLQPKLDCLVVGTNDIAKETGVFAGDQRAYLVPWLMQNLLAGKHHGITELDDVWNNFRDQVGFDLEAGQSVKTGSMARP